MYRIGIKSTDEKKNAVSKIKSASYNNLSIQ